VVSLVGLDGFESLGRDGGAGAAVDAGTVAGSGPRARVSKPSRARNAVERWAGRRSGSVGAAGSGAPWKGDLGLPGTAEETDAVGGQTASRPWAQRAHLVSAAGRWSGVRRCSRTGNVSRIEVGRNDADAGRTAQSVAGSTQEGPGQRSGTSCGMTDTVCANGRDGRVLDARKALCPGASGV
jgi:hypothetical protein